MLTWNSPLDNFCGKTSLKSNKYINDGPVVALQALYNMPMIKWLIYE